MNSAMLLPSKQLVGRRVLLMEDDPLTGRELTGYLNGQGATVIGPYPSLAAGLGSWIASEPVHIALLDITLRGEEVFPLADILVERGVAIVFVTANDRSTLPERFQASGYVQKPFEIDKLGAALRRAPSARRRNGAGK
jgi:DNA-binding response OmpR family regulator